MRETRVESWVCAELIKHGVREVKLKRKGWPDRAFFANGRTCFVEFKRPGVEDLKDPHQQAKSVELSGMGFPVFMINKKAQSEVRKVLRALGIDAKL